MTNEVSPYPTPTPPTSKTSILTGTSSVPSLTVSIQSWECFPSTLHPTDCAVPSVSFTVPENFLAMEWGLMVRAMLYTSSGDMLPVCWTEEGEGSRAVEGMDRRDNVEIEGVQQCAHKHSYNSKVGRTVKTYLSRSCRPVQCLWQETPMHDTANISTSGGGISHKTKTPVVECLTNVHFATWLLENYISSFLEMWRMQPN